MSGDLVERLRMVSNMIHMGERISWGQETTLMDEAADELTRLRKAHEKEIAVWSENYAALERQLADAVKANQRARQ